MSCPFLWTSVEYFEHCTSRNTSAPHLSSFNCFSWRWWCHPSPSPSLCPSIIPSGWIDRNLRFGILRPTTRNSRTKQSHYPSIHSPSASVGRFTSSSFFRRFPSIIDTKEGRSKGRANEKPIRSSAAGGALRTLRLLRATS